MHVKKQEKKPKSLKKKKKENLAINLCVYFCELQPNKQTTITALYIFFVSIFSRRNNFEKYIYNCCEEFLLLHHYFGTKMVKHHGIQIR